MPSGAAGGDGVTCILGAAHKGKVYMGGDSALVEGWMVRPQKASKIFKTGPFLIGSTGSPRVDQLLRYKFVSPKQNGQSNEKYMVVEFVETVRCVLKEGGYTSIENSREEGGWFLVGYRGSLYYVASDFQVSEYREGFHAIGSGRTFALGAYKALDKMQPKARILQSLKIAAHFSGSVMGPFRVQEL